MAATVQEMLGTDPKLRTAHRLLTAYLAIPEDGGPKAKAVAQAKFRGMCMILDSLRMAPTETAVELTVLDAIRSAPERPVFRFASDNTELRQWEADRSREIATELGWL